MRCENFEWDDRKAAAKVRKHGISFEAAKSAFDDELAFEQYDEDESDEVRWLLTGRVEGRLITVCYTVRNLRSRIISARKAAKNEIESYNSQHR